MSHHSAVARKIYFDTKIDQGLEELKQLSRIVGGGTEEDLQQATKAFCSQPSAKGLVSGSGCLPRN